MKKIKMLTIISGLFIANSIEAQKSAIETATFNVSGNCGMCKKTIDEAASLKGVKSASWNSSSKVLSLQYDKNKTSSDQVLRAVAYAGYDNEKYVAPDKAYNGLHGCCKYDRSFKAAPAGKTSENNQHKNHGSSGQTGSQEKESGIKKVYDQYFLLKDALVKSNATDAAARANDLVELLSKVNTAGLNRTEHETFMKEVGVIKQYGQKIASIKNLEKQRMAFSQLSESIFVLMKNISPGYEVYLDHCPMYNDGKGANWVSKEKPIKNPYYGSKMMTCGNISETLK